MLLLNYGSMRKYIVLVLCCLKFAVCAVIAWSELGFSSEPRQLVCLKIQQILQSFFGNIDKIISLFSHVRRVAIFRRELK
jgi:hypothetical protein